jgi:hypothetical protein
MGFQPTTVISKYVTNQNRLRLMDRSDFKIITKSNHMLFPSCIPFFLFLFFFFLRWWVHATRLTKVVCMKHNGRVWAWLKW